MTSISRVRRAGSRWRVLVHDYAGGGYYGKSHDIRGGMPYRGEQPSEYEDWHQFEGTEFDELVVGRWIHVEQMSAGSFWMDISGVVIDVQVDRDGRPKHVLVQHQPVADVTYEWATP